MMHFTLDFFTLKTLKTIRMKKNIGRESSLLHQGLQTDTDEATTEKNLREKRSKSMKICGIIVWRPDLASFLHKGLTGNHWEGSLRKAIDLEP